MLRNVAYLFLAFACQGHEAKAPKTEQGASTGLPQSQAVTPASRKAFPQISASDTQTCALLSPSELVCWGVLYFTPERPTYSPTPTRYILSRPAQQVASGFQSICLLFTDSSVECWGANRHYNVLIPETAAMLRGGESRYCAQTTSARVYCWGDAFPSNPNGSSAKQPGSPLVVANEDPHLKTATEHSRPESNGSVCGLFPNHTVFCSCYQRQPFTSCTATNLVVPQVEKQNERPSVSKLPYVTHFEVDGSAFCVARNDRTIVCGKDRYSMTRQETTQLPSQIDQLALAGNFACASAGGKVWCNGAMFPLAKSANEFSQAPGILRASDLSCGSAHACAIEADGTVGCWGATGGIGLDRELFAPRPLRVKLGERAIQLEASYNSACALLESGGVDCWGEIAGEQPGGAPRLPTRVTGIPKMNSLAVSERAGCAIARDGSLWCWGTAFPAGRFSPRRILSGPVSQLWAYSAEVCALSNGKALCSMPLGFSDTFKLGRNRGLEPLRSIYRARCVETRSGKLGCHGVWSLPDSPPELQEEAFLWTPVPKARQILGLEHIDESGRLMALRSDATWSEVKRWKGYNLRHFADGCGVLDDGSVLCEPWLMSAPQINLEKAPLVPVQGIHSPERLTAIGRFACAIVDGNVWCWGNNDHGQLGQGTGGAMRYYPHEVYNPTKFADVPTIVLP